MGCNCGKPKCDGHCGVSPAVLQINNPSECTLFHRVEVPASMGDSKTNPPKSGAYKNVLLYYEADQTSWLYSSDGIPQKLVNGLTNYEDAINLPQINGVTLTGDKSLDDLGITDAIDDAVAEERAEREAVDEAMQDELSSLAVVFDTVADMKASTSLVDGSYARTAGFHSVGDGGGALYHISNSGIANEMDVIAVDSLYATLIAVEANPLQFGAYGDNTHDDTSVLQACADYAKTTGLTFHVPNKTFLTGTVTIDEVKIVNIEGTINLSANTESLNVYENVNGATPSIYINKVTVGSIVMKGLNSASVEIKNANKLRLVADNTTNHNFIGYTNFKLGFIRTLELEDDASGSKWINENYFEGGRFQNVTIGAGSSAYAHHANVFNKPMCEACTWNFVKAYGNRVIKARLEGSCAINFSADSYANTVEQDYASVIQAYYYPKFERIAVDTNISVTDLSNGQNYVIGNPELIENKIISLNVINNPNSAATEGDKLKPGKNALIYRSELLPLPNKQFCIYIKASDSGFGFRIRCYDENKTLVASSPSPSLIKNSPVIGLLTVNTYGNGTYTRDNYWGIIVPNNPSVKYIDISVTTPNTNEAADYTFDYIDLYVTSYCELPSIVYQALSKQAS